MYRLTHWVLTCLLDECHYAAITAGKTPPVFALLRCSVPAGWRQGSNKAAVSISLFHPTRYYCEVSVQKLVSAPTGV
ncbi:MAG TPA: hypothetical protein V6D03_11775, partial [Candidatus Caenarcaniphilales bacterium]